MDRGHHPHRPHRTKIRPLPHTTIDRRHILGAPHTDRGLHGAEHTVAHTGRGPRGAGQAVAHTGRGPRGAGQAVPHMARGPRGAGQADHSSVPVPDGAAQAGHNNAHAQTGGSSVCPRAAPAANAAALMDPRCHSVRKHAPEQRLHRCVRAARGRTPPDAHRYMYRAAALPRAVFSCGFPPGYRLHRNLAACAIPLFIAPDHVLSISLSADGRLHTSKCPRRPTR